jgi:hypothetical protein
LAVACWLLVSVTLISGCSSSSTSARDTQTSTALKAGMLVPLDQAHNARADVHTVSCQPTSGAWVVRGTADNPRTSATGFQIIVDFVTKKGDTVLSTMEVNISYVAPKGSTSWSATGARGKSDVTCIMRQAQTT